MASSTVEVVLSKLEKFISSKASLLLGLEDEIGHVQMNLEWLLEFLADADKKQRGTQHRLVRVWVKQLREAACDLEDILDEYSVKLDLKRMGYYGWRASLWLHCFASPSTQLFTRHDLASKIQNINMRLERINKNRKRYLGDIVASKDNTDEEELPSPQEPPRHMINLFRTELEAYPIGQGAFVEQMKAKLLGISGQTVPIISIYGMRGSGKTTLAKRLYHDGEVAFHFNLRAWMTISTTFSGSDLFRRLLEKLDLWHETRDMPEDEMKRVLKDHLRGKRFILVVDDVWERSILKYLQTIFPEEHKEIVVLITTRFRNIATDVDPGSQVFELQRLNDEDSWKLFCKHAFTDANCPKDFLEFKDKVIRSCKGLPLAIIVLGGILRRRNDCNQWRNVLDLISVNYRREGDEWLQRLLALNYDDLPHHLKPCFLYVSGFPASSNISATRLRMMWIAEGFIQQQKGQTMEDSAEEYLEELVRRSWIQLVKRDSIGKVSVISVPGIMFDMARMEAIQINSTQRRLALCDTDEIRNHLEYGSNDSTSKLRSLHLYCRELRIEFPSNDFDFHSTKYLGVLVFSGIEFRNGKCPEGIGNMFQLRYLSFAETNLKRLSKNIKNLQNLQTLDISDTEVTQLPKEFWEIASLRHVIGSNRLKINPPCKADVNNKLYKKLQAYACLGTNPPSRRDATQLSNLQTLTGGILNYSWIMKDGLLTLTNIRTLHLRLGFRTLEGEHKYIKMVPQKLIDAIEKLKHLTVLELGDELASIEVLIARNTSLQHLCLWNRRLRRENDEEEERIEVEKNRCLGNHLNSLCLINMNLREYEIDLIGLLPNLDSLTIEDDSALRKLVFNNDGFSCLQQLKLINCSTLESWEVHTDFSKLIQRVKIGRCPCLTTLPQNIEVLEIKLRGELTRKVEEWAENKRRQNTNEDC